MNESHKELLSIGLTLGIVFFALFIIHKFVPSLIWAGIITIATYPVYQHWQRLFGPKKNLSALLFTVLISLILLIPLSWLITVLIQEIQIFINYLQQVNRTGIEIPQYLKQIPFLTDELRTYWENNLSHPGQIKAFFTQMQTSLTPLSYYVKQIGVDLAHRGLQLGFTLLTLFFFYRDGEKLFKQINQVGEFCLGKRWFHYSEQLPQALRSIVNGTIGVGLGVGILTGLVYTLVGFPAPTLTGFITALAAMIPFVAPLVFLVVATILAMKGALVGAVVVLIWGGVVLFMADHFIKPVLIGSAIQLPFLAVLFGILGGVETLGLLGLFVGPIVMVLFITLWKELNELPVEKCKT